MSKNSYNDISGLVRSLASGYSIKTGLALDECLWAANSGFSSALKNFNPQKSSLSTWAYIKVQSSLSEYKKNQDKKQVNLARTTVFNEKTMSSEDSKFDLRGFLFELSDDAKTLVKLVVENTSETFSLGRKQKRLRKEMFLEIAKKLQWTKIRIANSFVEIREALV